jgi:hypothetical protein
MTDYIPRRGDHLYAWRKIRMYQHHGIVVAKEDILQKLSPELMPERLESLMIVEQNIHGLDIVTLKQFRTEHPFNYEHDIGCARYRTGLMEYYLNRSGTCYTARRLEEDMIVDNAIRIYNDKNERDIWKTYSLVIRNCEQFAFICSTNMKHVLGEQVLLAGNVMKCFFINGMYNAVRFTFQIIRGIIRMYRSKNIKSMFFILVELAEQLISGMSVEMIIKGNSAYE